MVQNIISYKTYNSKGEEIMSYCTDWDLKCRLFRQRMMGELNMPVITLEE